MSIKTLDLFSGIGGFAIASQMVGGFETVGFCEIDPYCQKLLAQNFPGVPIHDDIKTLSADVLRSFGRIDCITGGFPCQDISVANPNGRGLEGERSGLFYELMRIVCECRPRYIVLENVAALLSKHSGRIMGTVLWELSESGYDAEWQTISAASVGAPHLRERVFIVAYRDGIGRNNRGDCREERYIYSNLNRSIKTASQKRGKLLSKFGAMGEIDANSVGSMRNPWRTEPGVLRVADGVPNRVDRIKGLGNAVVPQVAAIALQRVLEINSLHSLECAL